MNDTQLNELEGIRNKILNDVAPLASDNEDLEPAQRVELLMITAEAAEDPVPLVTKAYEIAKTIENVNQRANVLMDVLNSVELLLSVPEGEPDSVPAEDSTSVEPAVSVEEAPAEEQVALEPTVPPAPEPTQESPAEVIPETAVEPAVTSGSTQNIEIK